MTVDDDGPGIPVEEREAVFRPFYRLDAGRNVDAGGTGLGLSIARDIAISHGGDLILADSPLGGLRAILMIPAVGQRKIRSKTRGGRIKKSGAALSRSRHGALLELHGRSNVRRRWCIPAHVGFTVTLGSIRILAIRVAALRIALRRRTAVRTAPPS